MPRVKIHKHVSKHDCETCGYSTNDMYQVRGALGQFNSGGEAYCYGTENGNFNAVVNFIINALQEKGYVLNLPDFQEYERLNSTINWEEYHDGIDTGKYDWEDKVPDDVRSYNILEREIEHFYHTNWKQELSKCKFELKMTYSEDEDDEYYYED